VEVAIASTALITLLCLVIFAGRVSELAADVQTAAAAAARAASLQGTLAGADQAAQQTAAANLDDAGISCGTLDVATAGDIQPGGTVTVTITCVADMSSLAPLAPAGLSRSFVASTSEVIDTFRGTGT
jgi:Flp pilus assembly protein TadG